MKSSFIIGTLLLFLVAQVALAAQTQKWEILIDNQYYQSSYIRTLMDAGVSYVRQKGKFESTKLPLTSNSYWIADGSYATIERRNASDATYYRFNVSLIGGYFQQANPLVKASFVVKSEASNGNFIVTSYRYTVDPFGNPPFLGEADFWGQYALLDLRPLNNGTSDYSNSLNKAKENIVAQAIESGDLPDSSYKIQYVYGAERVYYHAEDYYEFTWHVKLVNTEGQYFYVQIIVEQERWAEEPYSSSYGILRRPSNE